MSEQAESALDSGSLSDLADFLSDTPEMESEEELSEETAEESTAEEGDTETEANDEQDIDPDAPDEGEEDEPAPVEKITVKVKGENGEDETLELTPDDIAASYLRQRDYTRKTQELATRENEAVQFLTQKHEQIRDQYISQAELTRSAIVQMAGLKSEDELAQLAQSDPAAWVAESQRQRQISGFLNGLSQKIEAEKSEAKAMAEQRLQQQQQQQFQASWEALSKDGIDKPKLAKIYGDVSAKYGFTNEELATVYDHRIVRVMKDAAAYQALQAQKPAVTQKAKDAPRLPSRQTPPANTRHDQALENKFKSGRAKLNDLAAYLR
jgi:hypothetical protein